MPGLKTGVESDIFRLKKGKIWRSGRHTPIKNSQEYSPGYPYQRELKEDNGTAPGLHNTRFMSQARQTRHFARNECVRLSWLLERLLCRPVCTMIRSLCGSCLMTGENSLENTFRPPSISPLSPSLTNACPAGYMTRGSVFKPDSSSLYQPFDTLVAEINTIFFRTVITVPSCAWYGTYSTAIALRSRKYSLLCNISFTLANKK